VTDSRCKGTASEKSCEEGVCVSYVGRTYDIMPITQHTSFPVAVYSITGGVDTFRGPHPSRGRFADRALTPLICQRAKPFPGRNGHDVLDESKNAAPTVGNQVTGPGRWQRSDSGRGVETDEIQMDPERGSAWTNAVLIFPDRRMRFRLWKKC
jgi:hypothetical protein